MSHTDWTSAGGVYTPSITAGSHDILMDDGESDEPGNGLTTLADQPHQPPLGREATSATEIHQPPVTSSSTNSPIPHLPNQLGKSATTPTSATSTGTSVSAMAPATASTPRSMTMSIARKGGQWHVVQHAGPSGASHADSLATDPLTPATTTATPAHDAIDVDPKAELDDDAVGVEMDGASGGDTASETTRDLAGSVDDKREIMSNSGSGAGSAGVGAGHFMLRIPAGAGLGTPAGERSSRLSSPTSGSGSGRKRRGVDPPVSSRSSRRRVSSPQTNTNTPARDTSASIENSPAPSSAAPSAIALEPNTAGTSASAAGPLATGGSATPSGNPLTIFAPPATDAIPEALQNVLSSTSSRLRRRDAPSASVAPEGGAAAGGSGVELRIRPTRGGREMGVRSGVSASGKGVKIGGVPRVVQGKKKGKGKAEADVPNQDFCSSCRGIGRFLCCDGCPRSFHFMCLEPPLLIDELPEEETWYCRKCRSEREESSPVREKDRERDRQPVTNVFKQLSKRLETENPVQFRLPQDIRQFFSGVTTGGRGEYVDAEELRTKYDRKGFQEERDGTRLRDGKHRPVSCYKCGGSSVPIHSLATDPEASWRQIVSCDYCNLHWHLDCLSPPLATMPNSGRKWMCPNHAEQVMPRRRTVRNNLETVEIESEGRYNNGNILVVPDEDPRPREEYEDMVINNRRYRVPERIIQLDFWDKMKKARTQMLRPEARVNGAVSSVLISNEQPTQDDLDAAALVLNLLQPPMRLTPLPTATPTTATTATAPTTASETTATTAVEGQTSVSHDGDIEMNGVHADDAPPKSTGPSPPKITLRVPRPEISGPA